MHVLSAEKGSSHRVKKPHVEGPLELDGVAEEMIEAEATQLLQRVLLASGDVPDVEIIEVVTEVEEWFSNNSADDNSVTMNAFSYTRRAQAVAGPWNVGLCCRVVLLPCFRVVPPCNVMFLPIPRVSIDRCGPPWPLSSNAKHC